MPKGTRYIIACAVICLIPLKARTQDKNYTKATGYVLDTLFKPIEYAAVQFVPTDTLNHRNYGTITNSSGIYTIKNLPLGKYQVCVSAIGYKPQCFDADITRKKINTTMKLVRLIEDIIEIEEARVVGERKGITERVDKMVFIPDSFTLNTARTGLDVLRRIPEVTVRKKDRSISILGSENILVLVNGVDNGRNIEAISPENIERIEIITHPSVKYRSDITSVLNVVLKGYAEDGITISSNAYYGLNQLKHYGSLNLDYQKGKLLFMLSYYGNIAESESLDTTYRFYYDENNLTVFETMNFSKTPNHSQSNRHKLQMGIDYTINDKNLISYTPALLLNDFSSNRSTIQLNKLNDAILEKSFLDGNYKSDRIQQNHSLFYKHKFDEKKELTVTSNFYVLANTSNHHINDSTLNIISNQYITERETNTDENQQSLNLRVDHTRDLSSNIDLDIGYQFYLRNIDSKTWSSGNDATSLDYNEFRNSVYTGLTFNNNKLGAEIGLRLEQFHVNVSDEKENKFTLLPFASLFYKSNPKHSFKLILKESLNYPSISYLNPYKFYYSDSLTYMSGNPGLRPEKNYMANMKYVYKRKRNYFSVGAYTNMITDIIAVDTKMENRVVGYKYQNMGTAYQYGVNFSMSKDFFDWIEFEAQARVSYTRFKDREDYNGFSYTADIGLVVPLPLGFDLEAYGFVVEKEIEYTGYSNYGGYIDEILLSKDITRNLFLGFAVWQPFVEVKDTYKQWDKSYKQTEYGYEANSRSFFINLTYFFRSGKKIEKNEKNLNMEFNTDNIKRGK
jgi:hypothetical protein